MIIWQYKLDFINNYIEIRQFHKEGDFVKFKAIFFDLDGTLIDTTNVTLSSLQKVLQEELGIKKTLAELSFTLGIPGLRALESFIKDNKLRNHINELWMEAVAQQSDELQLFPGVTSIVKQLAASEIITGIVTSQTATEFQTEFSQFGLNKYFNLIVNASMTKKHKPDPAPIVYAIKKINISPDYFLYVGDTAYDLESAHRAGTKFALAQWGTDKKAKLTTADYLLKKPSDILNLA